ncbi:type I methionyl aminopeptidase [Actinomyces sp. zg-332]|uniref:type I methionyl aminopeptidase n=1 Tax=Actinomyces sp. zg-332 TaxID=2708340 RepID=UPI00141EE02B|nr:type I methionyl aminopeptidase [Actinomyces sp. zg-332]QPK94270.1 type I methionyl aminopeptidase [Actinomyces sp. zg-332]
MGRIEYKTLDQMRHMRRAGLVVAKIHENLRKECKAGMTTADLDDVSRQTIASLGAKSNFLGYYGFPATVCISVNEVIVHGIPGKQKLRDGDLVSFDCGAIVEDEKGNQWHGDAAFTMIVGGDEKGAEKDRQLCEATRRAMWAGIASLSRSKTLSGVGVAVEDVVSQFAHKFGWEPDIVLDFIGHGIGSTLHQPPDVLNYVAAGRHAKIKPGLVVCVEPMLTAGKQDNRTLEDEWTVVTLDKSRAAHWEHTVAITPDGISVLSAPDYGKEELSKFGITPVSLD